MAGIEPDGVGSGGPGSDRGRAATEKALADLKAAGMVSVEARRAKAKRDISMSLVKLFMGIAVGAGLGWLYWTTESRWAFFGAAVLGIGPVIGALMKLYRGIEDLRSARTSGQG